MNISSLFRKSGSYFLGEIYLFCENCYKEGRDGILVITPKEREILGINSITDLKSYKCPRCGTPYGKGLYLYNPKY